MIIVFALINLPVFALESLGRVKTRNGPFAGQGHVTMSIIKIGDSTKWLPETKRA